MAERLPADMKIARIAAAHLSVQLTLLWCYRAELRAYTKSRTDEILHLNTSIAALKKQLEASEQEAYALEAKKDQQLQAATRKTLTYGQV